MGSSQIPDFQHGEAGAGSFDSAEDSSRENRAGASLKPRGAAISSFQARRGFAGGHVQTIASFLLPRKIHLPPAEERQVEVAPGVKVRCWCYWQPERPQPLTLLVVHGLEGSSESKYMMGLARNGLAAGMNVVLMNQRNCGGMDHCAPTLYNSSLSADVAAVARHILKHDHISRFALIGFSMGGNLVLKCAGEWGGDGPKEFKTVAAVCPAMDLAASADALHEPANRLYEWYFLWQLFRRIRIKARFFPEHFDLGRLRGVTSLRLFDDRVTAPYCGFTGADDYYARAAAANVVDRIAVPALIIHAANDPFIRVQPETLAKIQSNANITYVETKDGGHCAFMADPDGDGYDGRWAEREVVEFARQF